MKNGARAGKLLDCWTRMPVHPESTMRGEARESIDRQVGETGTTDDNSAERGLAEKQTQMTED